MEAAKVILFIVAIASWQMILVMSLASLAYVVRGARLRRPPFTFFEAFRLRVWPDQNRYTEEGWQQMRMASKYHSWTIFFCVLFAASVLVSIAIERFGG